jgi:drug/metabolite transporter (DMT)-like permease
MSLSFAPWVMIARHLRDVSMVPATALAQVLLLVISAPFALAGLRLGAPDVLWLALFGAGQIGVGLILMIGARLIPAAQAALVSPLELVLEPLRVWLAAGERATRYATVIGGASVIAAVIPRARDTTARRSVVP